MKILLSNIKPNPHRNLKRNPLKQDKIQELISSIHDTGFWDNVVVRPVTVVLHDIPAVEYYELAYGHHRLEAARLAGLTEADFIVKDISYEKMLEMMARENSETYRNDLTATIESVEALITAYAGGALEHPERLLPEEGKGSRPDTFRYAPSFRVGKPGSTEGVLLPYTASTVAKFLGFTKERTGGELEPADKVIAALDFLEMQERKLWDTKDIESFRDKDTGAIPVKKVLAARKDKETRESLIKSREAERAERTRDTGERLKARQEELRVKAQEQEEEETKILAEAAKADEVSSEERAKKAAERLEQKRIADAALIERLAEIKKEEQTLAKQVAKETADEAKRKTKQAERELTNFLVQSKDLRDEVDRILSTDSVICDRLKRWVRDPRVTDELRSLLQLSLRDLSARAADFNPFPTAAAKPKEEKC